MTEIPEHLLARTRARHEALALQQIATAERAERERIAAVPIGQALADTLLVEGGVLECSILASDVAKKADELFRASDADRPLQVRRLFMPDHLEDEDFAEASMELRGVGKQFATPAGYMMQLALGKRHRPARLWRRPPKQAPLELMAITRRDLAFPLARFSRSNQKYCDFLQLYGEGRWDELEAVNFYGWGTDDNGSRFDAVAALNTFLQNDGGNGPQLATLLKLDTRLEKQVGTHDEDTEAIIAQVFTERSAHETRTFKNTYANVRMGRSLTELSVTGRLEPVEDKPFRRRFTLRAFPSSQAEATSWPERIFVIDQRSGVFAVGDGESSMVASSEDVKAIRELLAASYSNQEVVAAQVDNDIVRRLLPSKKISIAYGAGSVAGAAISVRIGTSPEQALVNIFSTSALAAATHALTKAVIYRFSTRYSSERQLSSGEEEAQ